MNLSNITNLEKYKSRIKIITIFPPTWNIKIKELQEDNWQNKNLIRNIYKYEDEFWAYMKENSIIPENIVNEVESGKYKLFNLC